MPQRRMLRRAPAHYPSTRGRDPICGRCASGTFGYGEPLNLQAIWKAQHDGTEYRCPNCGDIKVRAKLEHGDG